MSNLDSKFGPEDDDVVIPTAAEYRRRIEEGRSALARAIRIQVAKAIDEGLENDKTEISVSAAFHPSIVPWLKSRGYEAEHSHRQMDGSMYIIQVP